MTYRMPVAAVVCDIPIQEHISWLQAVARLHGNTAMFRQYGEYIYAYTPGDSCWCNTCATFETEARHRLTGDFWPDTVFIVCPDCGNKRCPQAAWHEYECTGSNETGQTPRVKGIADMLDKIRERRE